MHVAFAANGRRIAEFSRDLFNRGSKISLRLRGAIKAVKLIEGHSREDRARPGAKVLRGDILAGDFLEIVVHIGRRDVLEITRFVHVLEQFLSRQTLTRWSLTRSTIACRFYR
jgi:hypothetical protein